MKTKLFAMFMAVTAVSTAVSSAVSVTVAGIANSSVGFVTLNGNNVSGRAIFVSTGTALTNVSTTFASLLNSTTTTPAAFDSSLSTLIGAGSPGIIRSTTFTSGVLASSGAVEAGSIGNLTYLFLVSEASGYVTGIGAYTGPAVPSLGAVTYNPTNAGDTLAVGTSVKSGSSGFQLAAAVPEPSAALLGALGALGLLRRRRN
ncbi:MAG: hypothetical protein KGQ87_10140 [Verrucomicrobia bacterium]|nr:hypothetical protein [Verrucomicrobiota bacterium]